MSQDQCPPVSPDQFICMICEGEESLMQPAGLDEPEVDLKHAIFQEPIVGTEKVLLDSHGPGAVAPRAISEPRPMTPAELAIHNLTHLPYHPGCPCCAAARRQHSQHIMTHEAGRMVPLMVGGLLLHDDEA